MGIELRTITDGQQAGQEYLVRVGPNEDEFLGLVGTDAEYGLANDGRRPLVSEDGVRILGYVEGDRLYRGGRPERIVSSLFFELPLLVITASPQASEPSIEEAPESTVEVQEEAPEDEGWVAWWDRVVLDEWGLGGENYIRKCAVALLSELNTMDIPEIPQ
jgi:hypothetical protein